MSLLSFDYRQTSLVSVDQFSHLTSIVKPEIRRLREALSHGYDTPYAFVNLISADQLYLQVDDTITRKRSLNISLLLVVGIGGSNLGTLAVHQALYGTLYNDKNPSLKFYCADTIDDMLARDLIALLECELAQGNTVLINIVTKSGTTTETLANAWIFIDVLKRYRPHDFTNFIVITTDKGSPLWHLGQNLSLTVLEIPKLVGGRYSVFSAVGLFPLGFMGVDLQELRAGARDMLAICTKQDTTNLAALSAAYIFANYDKGKNIHDLFLCSPSFAQLGAWYRQLMGESIGKQHKGITPTVSVGTTDLHSVAQLYLGGPYDKSTTFVIDSYAYDPVVIPKNLFPEISFIAAGKTLSFVKQAIFEGVQAAYSADKRPFVTLTLPGISAYTLGQFLQLKMIEMVYLGFLMHVNPFDQPQVELYKQETQRILADTST